MSDFFTPIERNAAFDPDKTALRFEGASLTYGAFATRVRAVAAGLLRDGVGPGDRIAVLSANHPDVLALLFASARIGAILAPLNYRLAHDELAFALSHAEPRLLVHDANHRDAAARLMPTKALRQMGTSALCADGAIPETGNLDGPCLLVYTSGTTGRPKGALLTGAALLGNAAQAHHMHQMSAADHILTVLPMFHVGGLNIQTTPALLAGATVTLHARFDPAATLNAITAERPTLTVLVPATISALLAQPGFAEADLSSLRAVATGSTIVPEPLIAALTDRGVPVLCVYGATETTPIAAYDRAGLARTKGATGRAGILCDLAILDGNSTAVPPGNHGEIAVRGRRLRSGWFRSRR
ncbi:MAG: AMP-binding protein, partial [Pseudomonadota bacterium]